MSSNNLKQAREEVLEAFGQATEMYGLRPCWGRVYGVVWFAEGEVAVEEIIDESGCERTAVTNALQGLKKLRAVETSVTTESDEYLEVREKNSLWTAMLEEIPQLMQEENDIVVEYFTEAESVLEDAPEGEARDRTLGKVRELQEYFDYMRETLKQYDELSEQMAATSS